MNSLQATDQASAAVAVAPRVKLSDIEAAIATRYTFTAGQAVAALLGPASVVPPLALLTVCILVMRNGFVVIGKSAPASPENFNRELGDKFAYEDAVRQLWPLMGYALRDRLGGQAFDDMRNVVDECSAQLAKRDEAMRKVMTGLVEAGIHVVDTGPGGTFEVEVAR